MQNSNKTATAEFFFEEGKQLRAEGKTKQAIEKYSLALDINPYFVPALCSLAEELIKKKDIQKAISLYQKAIAVQPNIAIGNYVKLANVLQINNQLNDSVEVYQKILERQPENILAKAKIAKIKMIQGDIEESKILYEEVMALVNPSPPLWLCADWEIFLQKTNQRDKAIEYYRQALKLQPDNFNVRNRLASIYKKLGKNVLPAFFAQEFLLKKRNSSSPLVIFDVGANIGEVAQQYADIFPNSKIHCFEPTPKIFKQLNQNIAFPNLVRYREKAKLFYQQYLGITRCTSLA